MKKVTGTYNPMADKINAAATGYGKMLSIKKNTGKPNV